MADNPNVTSFRGKDWLFNALWAPGNDGKAPRCTVRIPVTLLFRDGLPYKGLETDDATGFVQRINLEDVEPERSAGEVLIRGEGNRPLRVLRKLLTEYANKHNFYTQQKIDEPFICNVTYTDGEREDVNLKSLDLLLRNEPWRMQVLLVQGYVPFISKQSGRYSDDGVKKVRSMLESTGAEAADKLTKALAKFAEKVYSSTAAGAATLGRSRAAAQAAANKLGRTAPVEMKLIVKELHASYALDPQENVVFLYSDYTTVELDSGRREVEDFLLKEKGGRETAAAKAVYAELLGLLKHAQRRGLTTLESFQHFDTQRNGFVDTDLLIDGLGRLGIGTTFPVAEAVLELIGGVGAAFVSVQDFDRYLRVPSDVTLFEKGGVNTNSATSSSNSIASKKTKRAKQDTDDSTVTSSPSTSSQLYPPSKPKPNAKATHSVGGPGSPGSPGSPGGGDGSTSFSLEASQMYNWQRIDALDGSPTNASASASASVGANAKSKVYSSQELPLPEAAYTSERPKDLSIQLPSWTSKRNKKALKELRTSADKWGEEKAKSKSTAAANANSSNANSTGGSARPAAQTNRASSPSRSTTPGTPSRSNRKPGSAGGASGKPPSLSLANIRKEMTHKLSKSPDELLHLDAGVVMTYRVIVGKGHKDIKTQEETEVLRYKSILEERERNLDEIGKRVHGGADGVSTHAEAAAAGAAGREAGGHAEHKHDSSDGNASTEGTEEDQDGKPDRWLAFTLVVVPDLFMTLDAMHKALEPILVKYPHSRVVCVGLPGLPNTVWPAGWVLGSDLHARSIAKLLQYLKSKQRLAQYKGEPIFLLAFGAGVYSTARFISLYAAGLPWLEYSLKAVVLVNGVLKHTRQYKQTCKDLRQSMLTATAHETNELITSLHFWDRYLVDNDRDDCLRKFWLSRRGLVADGYGEENHGQGFVGVLEMLRAIMIQPDDFDGAEILVNAGDFGSKLPLLVVQSTEDIFVNPRHAAMYQPDRLPPERTLVKDIVDCLDDGAVHVSWLKAGHEVLQERNPFILGLVSNLAQMCGIHPSEEEKQEAQEEDSDIFDVLELAARKRQQAKEEQEKREEEEKRAQKELAREEKRKKKEAKREEERLAQQMQLDEEARIAEASAAAELAAEAQRQEEIDRAQEAAAKEEEQGGMVDDAERRERNNIEKERRAKLAAERRKREAREKRRSTMQAFYDRERLEKERKQEERETTKMIKEDRRSKFAEDYRIAQAGTARNKRLAQQKAEKLKVARKEEAIKRVEDKMNRERAIRSEERRKKALAAVLVIEGEVLNLSGQAQEGGYDAPPEGRDVHGVMALIVNSHRIMTDLMECREKSVEAMRRQVLVEEKFNVFRRQVTAVEHDVRQLRQAMRMIELNPQVLAASGGSKDGKEEFAQLKKNLFAKEETYSELTAVALAREAQLSAANRSVQMLKMAIRERDALMLEKIDAMRDCEERLSNEALSLRNKREALIETREKIKLRLMVAADKVKSIEAERKRIAPHKGKLIDSDAWVEGVMQRQHTKELKAQLKAAHKAEEAKAQAIRDELSTLRDEIFELDDRINAAKRDADKIGVACRHYNTTYQRISSVTVVDVMKSLSSHQEGAEKGEERRQVEARLKGLMDDAQGQQNSSSTLNPVEVVRLKDFDLRTKDERKFVGMDLILNPEAYLHVPMVEAEQMRFDDDYNCDLAKTDLERIMNLPEQIALALPFLHTVSEVQAHRLFNKFLRNLSDEDFRIKDHLYEGGAIEDVNSEAGVDAAAAAAGGGGAGGILGALASKGVTQKEMQEAETAHDILVRECRRDRVRAKGAGDDLPEEERNWLQIDKILSPHIFGVSENTRYEDVRLMPIDIDLSSSKMRPPVHDRITTPGASSAGHARAILRENALTDASNDGDKYRELQWRHENGEMVFDDSWRCPFTPKQLMEIKYRTSMDGASDEELLVRRLLDRYHVSEHESTLGHARLYTLQRTLHKVTTFINTSEQEALIDAKIKKAERAALHKLDELQRAASLAGAAATVGSDSADTEDKAEKAELARLKRKLADGQGRIKRLWGSWEQIHPAAGGAESQRSYFMKSAFDPSRDHPASFGMHEETLHSPEESSILTEKKSNADHPGGVQKLAMDTLLALPGGAPNSGVFDPHDNDPNSLYVIVDTPRDLAIMEVSRIQGKIALIASTEPLKLFDEKDLVLNARQSRAHRFELPNRDDSRVLDVTVSIIFQGNFANKGYKLGRLAAGLFRLPDERHSSDATMPEPVGYAPYSMQSPNLPDHLGRIVILHRPKYRPIKPGFFQLVIGTASSTKYSVLVTARTAQAALPVVDNLIVEAKSHQQRLPNILHELDDLQESLRLAERKLLVCGKMAKEAEAESSRCQRQIAVINHKLVVDDEEMTMLEDDRREHERELGILEVEFAQWATVFGSRCQEIEDIKEGIKLIFEFQRRRQQEKKALKKNLEAARHDLPACIAALRGIQEATNVAAALNTTVQGASAAWAASFTGESTGPSLRTPADEIRRRMKREGFKSLILEEQQWCMLDQSINPHKYEWLREQEEEENAARLAMGKPLKERKYNVAVDAFRLPKHEVLHVMKTPFSMLSRQQVVIRKLLTKFHDDPGVIAKKFAAAAYGFDPHLAEKTRAKAQKMYNQEEKEWASVDRQLHPEVWAYYVNHEKFTESKRKEVPPNSGAQEGQPQSGGGAGGEIVAAAATTAGKGGAGGGAAARVGAAHGAAPQSKAQAGAALGKILGLGDKISAQAAGGADLKGILDGAQKQLVAKAKDAHWRCPFDRQAIMRIWRTAKHRLTNDDERRTFTLLQKFNGSFQAYQEAIEEKERRAANGATAGSHIRWGGVSRQPTLDTDLRAREVLHEIDRAAAGQAEYMTSDVLHTREQMFPTPVLRVQLEEELDNILAEQVRDRERAERARVDSDSESGSGSDDDEALDTIDPSLQGEEADKAKATLLEKVQRRAKRRAKRNDQAKGPDVEKEILAVKKKLNVKGKSGRELEELALINKLGFGGCLACRFNPCKWSTGIDRPIVLARKEVLDKESERVRLLKDQLTIESDVCLSAQQGGNKVFKRMDLLEELAGELSELNREVHLDDVDKELHDAYASRQEFIEVVSLHGYSMMLWVNNARMALESRQTRLCAVSVAKEAIDDILDWMLEGWYFGERESTFPVLGRVPSVAPDGKFVRPGQDQIKAIAPVIAKMKKRKAAKKAGIVLPETVRGVMEEKAKPVEQDKDMRLERLKVARDGNRHEHMLNETERTLKFGLFMMALMYFRAMAFVKREQRSWAGDDDEIGAGGKRKPKVMTDERMLMLDEENKAAARKKKVDAVLAKARIGEQRRIDRENAERREMVLELQKVVRRQKLEFASVTIIQRIYRGHVGRKAAKRWALKRAELGAMHALLHATAICVQRCYRGYLARVNASKKRAEMAAFIALMRAQEAKSDEEVYWATHPWQRYKRDGKDWMDKKLRAAHQVEVLGGARLSEEEQEDLLLMRQDQILDELAREDSEEEESDEDEGPPGETPGDDLNDDEEDD